MPMQAQTVWLMPQPIQYIAVVPMAVSHVAPNMLMDRHSAMAAVKAKQALTQHNLDFAARPLEHQERAQRVEQWRDLTSQALCDLDVLTSGADSSDADGLESPLQAGCDACTEHSSE